MPLIFDL